VRKMLIPERECEVVRNKQRDSGAFEGNYCCTIERFVFSREKKRKTTVKDYKIIGTLLVFRKDNHFILYTNIHIIIFVYSL
jgi:hypothetical protein